MGLGYPKISQEWWVGGSKLIENGWGWGVVGGGCVKQPQKKKWENKFSHYGRLCVHNSIVHNPISCGVGGWGLEANPQPVSNPFPSPNLGWGPDPGWHTPARVRPPDPGLGGLEGVGKALQIVKILNFS